MNSINPKSGDASLPPHEYWMRHTLHLAAQGKYSAAPNPRVGCVIVKNDALIGAGFHQAAGTPHAEVHALRMAGAQARGAVAYVSLEPCAHFGRTPPCADALIAAGIAEVIIACRDPNPQVAGKGIAKLQTAGVVCTVGVCEQEALDLNRAFFHRMRTGLPFVSLKLAASMDGRTALANGESQWITGAAARENVHEQRLAADAILAGSGSVIADNARLNARYPTARAQQQPIRVIIDSRLRIPAGAALFAEASPVIIATLETTPARPELAARAEILRFAPNPQGKVPLRALLEALGRRQINHVFAEAGAALGGAMLDEGLADEVQLYLAPVFLGADARPLLLTAPLPHLSAKIAYRICGSRMLGEDWHFTLRRATQD